MIEKLGLKAALTVLSAEADVDTSDYNSPIWVSQKLEELVAELDWLSVYRVLEEQAPTSRSELETYASRVNEMLSRTGVAYEMANGRLRRLDMTGGATGVNGDERRDLEVPPTGVRAG